MAFAEMVRAACDQALDDWTRSEYQDISAVREAMERAQDYAALITNSVDTERAQAHVGLRAIATARLWAAKVARAYQHSEVLLWESVLAVMPGDAGDVDQRLSLDLDEEDNDYER